MKAVLLADDTQVDSTAGICVAVGAGIELQAFSDSDLVARDPGKGDVVTLIAFC